jgi:alpha-mannosidase
MEIVDKNLEISSAYVEDDALIVRFYNSSSDNKPQRILWNCDVEKIELIGLNGDTVAQVPCQRMPNGQIFVELELPQFGFQTLKLKGIRVT